MIIETNFMNQYFLDTSLLIFVLYSIEQPQHAELILFHAENVVFIDPQTNCINKCMHFKLLFFFTGIHKNIVG